MLANKRKFSLISLVDHLLYKAICKLTTKGINVDKHPEELTKAQETAYTVGDLVCYGGEEESTHVLSDQYTDVMVNPLGTVTAYKINDSSGTLYIIGTTAQTLKTLGVVFEAEEVLVVELFPLQHKKNKI